MSLGHSHDVAFTAINATSQQRSCVSQWRSLTILLSDFFSHFALSQSRRPLMLQQSWIISQLFQSTWKCPQHQSRDRMYKICTNYIHVQHEMTSYHVLTWKMSKRNRNMIWQMSLSHYGKLYREGTNNATLFFFFYNQIIRIFESYGCVSNHGWKGGSVQHLFNNTLKTDLTDICLSKESGNAIYLTSSMTVLASSNEFSLHNSVAHFLSFVFFSLHN